MVVSKRAATARAAHPKGGHTRRGAAWAEQSGGVSSIAQTFKTDAQHRISLMELMTRIRTAGIGSDDPRVREIVAELPDGNSHDGGGLTMQQFTAVCEASGGLIARALRGDLAVPDFARLESELAGMYDRVQTDNAAP
jgi:glutaminase